ncbi:MAG: PhzF family phenazine biosynthesis protein [Nitrospiraceae bacterium]
MPSEARTIRFYQADVFSDRPFGGNPVAVFPEAAGLDDLAMQRIAREMNLSETVFVFPPTDPTAAAKLRIFTPTKEIPFAGHPVVGTFYILAALKRLTLSEPVTRILQECNLGLFPVEIVSSGGELLRVVMSQPAPQFLGPLEDPRDRVDLVRALGLTKAAMGDTKCPIEIASTGLPVLIVPIRTLTAVRSVSPNGHDLAELCARIGVNAVSVFTTVTVDPRASVHARVFAPLLGIPEDPATGSAAGALGAYLVHHGVVQVAPTTEIVIEQGYEIERPSRIVVQVESDDDAITDVKVGGRVVMVIEGTLTF